jgi:hypothetical protein
VERGLCFLGKILRKVVRQTMSSSYKSLFTESLNHLNIIDDDDEALALCLVIKSLWKVTQYAILMYYSYGV